MERTGQGELPLVYWIHTFRRPVNPPVVSPERIRVPCTRRSSSLFPGLFRKPRNRGHKTMHGWIIPPPKEPVKTAEEFREERERKIGWLLAHGYLRSERIRSALLTVRREDFIPAPYRDYAYSEVPLPLPGKRATISCPHSYPLFYEPLGLDEGHRFLEIGLGSGYGAALAQEIVGSSGLVVSVEIDPVTFEFARRNLERAGYRDIMLVLGDGGLGAPTSARFDRICMTAACTAVPPPLLEQMETEGSLIVPLMDRGAQQLTLIRKAGGKMERTVICQVLYVSLRGRYGAEEG